MRPNLSIVIAVLDSHEAVRRQCLYWTCLPVPEDVEIILVDDGSTLPLIHTVRPFASACNIRVLETGDLRPWSQPCARNAGARVAKAPVLLMTDIDHILTRRVIYAGLECKCDKMMFKRQYAVINKDGNLTTDPQTLIEYGLKGKKKLGPHYNTFAMKKRLFEILHGYDEKFCGKYGGDDVDLSHRYGALVKAGVAEKAAIGPRLYVFPNPRKDVKKLFHKLRKRSKS